MSMGCAICSLHDPKVLDICYDCEDGLKRFRHDETLLRRAAVYLWERRFRREHHESTADCPTTQVTGAAR